MSEWISVKKKLPEDDEPVLFISDKGFMSTGFHADGIWYYDGDPKWHPIVTYWMPLPDPPKETQ